MRIHKSTILILSVFLLCLAFVSFFFLPGITRSRKAPTFLVRVRLLHNARVSEISCGKKCVIRDARAGVILENSADLSKETKITATSSGIKIGGMNFDTPSVRISPAPGNDIRFNGRGYRGEIDIHRKRNGFDAVNAVELEDYLKGVIPKEVNHLWPFAALKAQAIVSRSYAVFEAVNRKDKEYDLRADTYSQVYGGKSAEKRRTSKAVDATKGKVLEYEGKVFPSYFHSCCGGHTEDVSRLWMLDLKPLKGVRCSWCRWSPYYRWIARIKTEKIIKSLRKRGYDVDRVDNIKTGRRNASGRLENVSIRSGNRWIKIKAENFCSALGKSQMKSTNFRVKKYPRFYLFSGHGWGHGVGMCQWGALGLAIRWKSGAAILKRYYPGTRIVDLRNILKNEAE